MDQIKLCRTCLSDHIPTNSVFSHLESEELYGNTTYSDILMRLTSLKILKNDGLPQNICKNCQKQINNAFQFSKACERSNSILLNLLNKEDVKLEAKLEANDIEKSVTVKAEDVDLVSSDLIDVRLESGLRKNDTDTEENDKSTILQPVRYICSLCNKTYKFQKNLERHKCHKNQFLNDNKNQNSNELMCYKPTENVSKTDQTNQTIFKEKRNKDSDDSSHGDNVEFDNIDTAATEQESEDDFVMDYSCDICSKTFKFRSLLNMHKRTHFKERPFLCSICGKGFADKYGLRSHSITHSEKKPYTCNFCQSNFRTQGALKVHVRVHTGEKPYSCKECNKSFRQSANLIQHERIHSGEKPFECQICQKKFNHSGKLKVHFRTHSGERPFGCPHCNRYFAVKDTLKKHLWTHTGGRPFKYKKSKSASEIIPKYPCDICNKMFKYKANLISHKRTHTNEKPYLCSTCGKVFAEKHGLKVHLNIHTGEKPFTCKICDSRFSAPTALTIHMRRHTGVKPYNCNVCGKSFFQASNLISHKRTHTGEKPYECNLCFKK
ncbi:hypothetical protein GWI33_012282 [Rhynchophorus ferrugineus]|uniref:Uncharacterized protein n=1 Tax=Rhynchophorus ferrugineus TaxID=354439 RepID=A0A834I9J6_RHYFE|nr:hypothetical protein GWI33_012282 [Rhynchophorus ferrugineus]